MDMQATLWGCRCFKAILYHSWATSINTCVKIHVGRVNILSPRHTHYQVFDHVDSLMVISKHDTKNCNRQEHVDPPTHLQAPQIFSGYHRSQIITRYASRNVVSRQSPSGEGWHLRIPFSGAGQSLTTIRIWDTSVSEVRRGGRKL